MRPPLLAKSTPWRPVLRARDHNLERYLATTAAAAHGFLTFDALGQPTGDTGGLDAFADHRAHAGGVRPDLDADQETAEELADARNYLLWGIEPIYRAVVAGESVACADYGRRMRALGHVIAGWHALHRPAT